MEVFRLLDEMEDMIRQAKKLPFSSRVSVDPVTFLEYIDHLRAVLPEELDLAQQMMGEREAILEEAKKHAEALFENSRNQVAAMVDNDMITRSARDAAETIIAKARNVGEGIVNDANQYADDLLAYMERVLNEGLGSIHAGREELNRQIHR